MSLNIDFSNVDPSTEQSFDPNNQPTQQAPSVQEASAEEQQLLDATMDSVEGILHGQMRDKVTEMLDASPELWQSVSQTASMLVQRVAHKLDEQQLPNDGGIFFAENGVIQQTVEMLWEMADAMGHPAAQDNDQFSASYLSTLALLGETMVEDEESAREAQDFLLEQEAGYDVVSDAASQMEQELLAERATQAVPEPASQATPTEGRGSWPPFFMK